MNPRKILAPIRLTPGSRTAVNFAARVAEQLHAALILLHVVQLKIADERLGIPRTKLLAGLRLEAEAELRDLARQAGITVPVEFVVAEGPPADVILEKAASLGAEAIILVTHACPRWLRWLHGNTALKVMHRASCPVWGLSIAKNGHWPIMFFLNRCLPAPPPACLQRP